MRKAKIGSSWSRRIRKIDGHRKAVKVRKIHGRVQIRQIGVRNLTDKSAKRLGRSRKHRYYSSTDAGARKHRIHRRH